MTDALDGGDGKRDMIVLGGRFSRTCTQATKTGAADSIQDLPAARAITHPWS